MTHADSTQWVLAHTPIQAAVVHWCAGDYANATAHNARVKLKCCCTVAIAHRCVVGSRQNHLLHGFEAQFNGFIGDGHVVVVGIGRTVVYILDLEHRGLLVKYR